MRSSRIKPESLVLYKGRPGRVVSVGAKKILVALESSEQISVRPKDIVLLHEGPLENFLTLKAVNGEIETAWELLQGETTSVAELAELAYGSFTPGTAWSVWQHVEDGVYFSGQPQEITVHSKEKVSAILLERQAKKEEQETWEAFVSRTSNGIFEETDRAFLDEVEALALGHREQSRVLKNLGHAETAQVAHAFLLRLGYWLPEVNPYPSRAGISMGIPEMEIPDLPREERRDLSHLKALAIDDVFSNDPDDALSFEDGRLWVHIADVAAMIPPDSPADREARGRGANLYLPEGTIPMLPERTTQVLGLGLAEVSPALSFGINLNDEGEIQDVEIAPSWIRVTRMTYEEAESQLDSPLLGALGELANLFEERRRREGAIFINLPEVKVTIKNGKVDVRSLAPLRSRDIVREAMLIAGASIARFVQEKSIPVPFSTQDSALEVDPEPSKFSEMFALRRFMKPSQHRCSPAPHSGLGLPMYVKVTSPLRRYLDLVVHQQLRAYSSGDSLLDQAEILGRIGVVEAIAGSMRWAERRSGEHWTLVYLMQNPHWRGKGIVVDQRGAQSVVILPDLALETTIYSHGDLPLDSSVNLRLQGVNLPELEAHFTIEPS